MVQKHYVKEFMKTTNPLYISRMYPSTLPSQKARAVRSAVYANYYLLHCEDVKD